MTGPSHRAATYSDVQAYVDLARAFLRGDLSATGYETAFFELFRRQDFVLPPDLFAVVQELFFAAEDYMEDDHLRDAGELDASGLRSRVASVEPRLAELVDQLPR